MRDLLILTTLVLSARFAEAYPRLNQISPVPSLIAADYQLSHHTD